MNNPKPSASEKLQGAAKDLTNGTTPENNKSTSTPDSVDVWYGMKYNGNVVTDSLLRRLPYEGAPWNTGTTKQRGSKK